jgi:hypothetical protein
MHWLEAITFALVVSGQFTATIYVITRRRSLYDRDSSGPNEKSAYQRSFDDDLRAATPMARTAPRVSA